MFSAVCDGNLVAADEFECTFCIFCHSFTAHRHYLKMCIDLNSKNDTTFMIYCYSAQIRNVWRVDKDEHIYL